MPPVVRTPGQRNNPLISLQGRAEAVGSVVHVGAGVDVAMLEDGASPAIVVPFTKTGITAPVAKENLRCPIAVKSDPIEPEWLVSEMKVLSSLRKMSFNSSVKRAT